MENLNFSDIDTIKAFFTILLGSAIAAILVYVYDSSIAPALRNVTMPTVTATK